MVLAVKDAQKLEVSHKQQSLRRSTRNGCFFITDRLKDGFECPKEGQKDANGNLVVHPKFAHPTDCQRFYVCLNGKEPRDLGCQVGEVYNEETQRCDAPENVPGW